MNEQIPKYFDKILDEVIPIYLSAMSTKNKLESDIAKLQRELPEIETDMATSDDEETELYFIVENKENTINRIEKLLPKCVLATTAIVPSFLIVISMLISIKNPTSFIVWIMSIGGISGFCALIAINYKYSKPISTFCLNFLYNHSKKYKELKDSLEKDKEKYSELRQKSLDITNEWFRKLDELDNKKNELEKLSESIREMERKAGRNTILKRAVIFGVPSKVLNFIQNSDEILKPSEELSTEEDGKGQYALNAPSSK